MAQTTIDVDPSLASKQMAEILWMTFGTNGLSCTAEDRKKLREAEAREEKKRDKIDP